MPVLCNFETVAFAETLHSSCARAARLACRHAAARAAVLAAPRPAAAPAAAPQKLADRLRQPLGQRGTQAPQVADRQAADEYTAVRRVDDRHRCGTRGGRCRACWLGRGACKAGGHRWARRAARSSSKGPCPPAPARHQGHAPATWLSTMPASASITDRSAGTHSTCFSRNPSCTAGERSGQGGDAGMTRGRGPAVTQARPRAARPPSGRCRRCNGAAFWAEVVRLLRASCSHRPLAPTAPDLPQRAAEQRVPQLRGVLVQEAQYIRLRDNVGQLVQRKAGRGRAAGGGAWVRRRDGRACGRAKAWVRMRAVQHSVHLPARTCRLVPSSAATAARSALLPAMLSSPFPPASLPAVAAAAAPAAPAGAASLLAGWSTARRWQARWSAGWAKPCCTTCRCRGGRESPLVRYTAPGGGARSSRPTARTKQQWGMRQRPELWPPLPAVE